MGSRHVPKAACRPTAAAVLIASMLSAGPATAQTFVRDQSPTPRRLGVDFRAPPALPILDLSLRRTANGPAPRTHAIGEPSNTQQSKGASIVEDVLLGVGGAVGGFFGGGFIGYGLDRYAFGGDHCACDDPGFRGFLWGAFVGAITLPIVLIKWLE